MFFAIKRAEGSIGLSEWSDLIATNEYLEQAPVREGINPFTQERVVFSMSGVAYYLEAGRRKGNICLEDGRLLATGVPRTFCAEVAVLLGASLYEEDRS